MAGYRLAIVVLVGVSFWSCISVDRKGSVSPTPPERVVEEFYRWYASEVSEGRFPLKDSREAIGKSVSRDLQNELDRLMGIENGLKSDYFLRAQDWPDDWRTAVNVAAAAVDGQSASTIVTLGGAESNRQRLKVRLRLESGGWRIIDVSGA